MRQPTQCPSTLRNLLNILLITIFAFTNKSDFEMIVIIRGHFKVRNRAVGLLLVIPVIGSRKFVQSLRIKDAGWLLVRPLARRPALPLSWVEAKWQWHCGSGRNGVIAIACNSKDGHRITRSYKTHFCFSIRRQKLGTRSILFPQQQSFCAVSIRVSVDNDDHHHHKKYFQLTFIIFRFSSPPSLTATATHPTRELGFSRIKSPRPQHPSSSPVARKN